MAQSIALFQALGAKMDYLSERQRIISQNIANADTPGYVPKDLRPINFGAILKDANDGSSLSLATTSAGHLPDTTGGLPNPKSEGNKKPYEVAPAGNAVIMEEQLINSNQTVGDYNLAVGLYEKNMRLLKISLGVQ
jgi:flagellar basal-body rod protein FlgB